MFQESEDGDDEKDLGSEAQPLILQGSLDGDGDERVTPTARKSHTQDSTNCISCKGLPQNGRRITLFLKLFITSMIIACALYISLVYFTPLTKTTSSSSKSELKSELDCTEADGCKGQASVNTTNSQHKSMPKIPTLTNKQTPVPVRNPIASFNASSLVTLAAGLSVGLISATDSSVINLNGSDPKLCSKPELFEIKTELNIPDLYKQIQFPEFDSMQAAVGTNRKDKVINSTTNVDVTRWTQENKLKIFAVLHSHNDAGWGETFEGYYHQRTKSILDRLLKYLTLDPELKFIWCEISFFDFWWKSLRWKQRLQVKKLVDNKQLEFVGGAWVMHDEASPHYFSMVTQLIEGHQWLEQHLKYAPRNGWAIDPFGLSSTSNFLLQQSGFKNTVFSRVHYKLLELLKKKKTVEYYWRQPWDLNGTTDIFVYQMPYGTYDKSGTCGPDYVTESGICTPYKSHVANVKKTAIKLLQQYRKKAVLFRTNNLFMPLGADFDYQTDREWTTDIDNLKTIFKYINSNKDLNTEIKFSTLDEYFKAVHADEKDKKFPLGPSTWKTPVFSGDFFTYSDAKVDYWSGYYTSRIFHKSSERQLMTLVRSAQLMYTLVVAEIAETFGNLKFEFIGSLLEKIVMGRRILSIFQHHDGITGTSRDRVVRDYAIKLFQGMKDCHFVIQQCLHVHVLQNERRLANDKDRPKDSRENLRARLHNIQSTNVFYNPSMTKSSENELWTDVAYKVNYYNQVKRILVFNPLAKARKQVIRVSVTSLDVKVRDANDKRVFSEIFPKMKFSDEIKSRALPLREEPQYELFFVAEFLPLEMRHFKICYDNSTKRRQSSKARVTVFNTKTSFYPEFTYAFLNSSNSDSTTEEISSKAKTITISNDYLKLNFHGNGSAQSVEMGGTLYPFDLTFNYYKTQHSGLYSFFPDGGDRPIEMGGRDPIIIVAKGKLLSYVEAWYPTVRHRVMLVNHDGPEGYGIEVENVIDIRSQKNYELTMKIRTGIQSGEALFTDSNGFQMMRREYRKNLPIQGNFYPMASSAFIEDPDLRLTILVAQPGGIASLTSGQLEIMLDRIINQDDNHGIGQGGTDNLVTVSKFKIILEKPTEICRQSFAEESAGPGGDGGRKNKEKEKEGSLKALPLLSEEANLQQLNLLHPLLIYNKLGYESTHLKRSSGHSDYTFSSSSPPCDIHLLGAMPMPEFTDSDEHKNDTAIFMDTSERSALLFHRMGFDRRFTSHSPKLRKQCSTGVHPPGQLTITDLFGTRFKKKVLRTSLSLSRPDRFFDGSATLLLEPMHIHSFIGYYNSGNEGARDRDSQESTITTKTVFTSSMPTAFGVK